MSLPSSDLTLFTVGHSTHPLEYFLELLRSHGIQALADVRSSPFSRFNPQYNRDNLKRTLKHAEIYYVELGRELGARRAESECYVGNKVSYPLVVRTPLFQQGLERLRHGAAQMRVAIMCAEKDPLECHRTVLVAHYARSIFSHIDHIREDGNLETQASADRRLLAAYGVNDTDFFRPRADLLEEAYRRRGEEIAFEETHEKAAG